MKSLQPQNLCLETGPNADMQEIDPLKALKNPAHGGPFGGLVDLIGNGLFGFCQSAAKEMLS